MHAGGPRRRVSYLSPLASEFPSYHPSQVTPCMAEDLVSALRAKRLGSLGQRQAACADLLAALAYLHERGERRYLVITPGLPS